MIVRREESATVWTIAELLRWTEARFHRLGIASARLDAEILLAHALGKKRLDLYTGYHMLVEPAERTRFRGLVERRLRLEPIAYITGQREFHSLSFEVNAGVLVPRPETEHLVEEALKVLAAAGEDYSRARRVLDVCTGSGCVAVAIAVNAPAAVVVATDVSPPALEVARRNALAHGVAGRIKLIEGDLYAALGGGVPAFDVIVANPPYVSAADFAALPADVRHEPELALLDVRSPGRDGLGFYRDLAAGAGALLAPGGAILVEVGAGQAPAVRGIFESSGLHHRSTRRDLGGIDRVVVHGRG